METRSQLTREQMAHREVGHTDVSPRVARGILGLFLLLIVTLPVFELWQAAAGDASARAPWTRLREIPSRVEAASGLFARNRAILEALHAFENALEDESRIGQLLRPPAQLFLTRFFAAGNEQAYIGRDRWLFYRADVDYVTSPGFMKDSVRERRAEMAREWTQPPQTDPFAAIQAFKRELDARGIALVIVPVPLKPTVHPEMLTTRLEGTAVAPQNADYAGLVARLRQDGVIIVDPTDALVRARQAGASQYLRTDTHWRPEAMELVAEQIAETIMARVPLPPLPDPQFRTEPLDISGRGDIFAMLDLPERQALYDPEFVSVRRIVAADGSAWRSSREADVLLLGDSFTNIYSLESMGWGTGGGLAEQLSFVLQRPIDRIVQNDAGAYATRELLQRAGPERLAPKKVVVWQFAARELAFGDWKVLDLPR